MSSIRTKRLPQFQFAILAGHLLHGFDFTFPRGAFGTYSGVGPVPNEEAKVHTPAEWATYLTAALDQPLTQQYKISLGIRATELGREIAREDVRAERQKIAAQVRSSYFNLVALQTSVDAARRAVQTLREAQRVTARHQKEEAILQGDALEIEARLAKARYDLSVAENGLATQREALNQLLGRDVATRFRVHEVPEDNAADLTLELARRRAAANRPETRQAALQVKHADIDRRLAQAEYIPDLSISVRYQGIYNVEVLPDHVSTAGFFLSWEPFDWGRRHHKIAEKRRVLEQAKNGVEETRSQIAVEVGAKYRKWQESVLLLKASRTAREAAAEQLRAIANKYNERVALLKDFLAAQARSSETHHRYQRALFLYGSALAELRKAMGEE